MNNDLFFAGTCTTSTTSDIPPITLESMLEMMRKFEHLLPPRPKHIAERWLSEAKEEYKKPDLFAHIRVGFVPMVTRAMFVCNPREMMPDMRLVQVRFPRSKKKRIRKKWARNRENFLWVEANTPPPADRPAADVQAALPADAGNRAIAEGLDNTTA